MELRGQLTKLTEMVERLTEQSKRRKDRGSRGRRRSRTRSRRGRARDVRDSSSRDSPKAPRTPQRAPRSPSCPPPSSRREQASQNDDEEDDMQTEDKSWKVEKSWWQAYNEKGSSSDLAHVDARSLDPSKMTHEDLEWYVGDEFLGTSYKDKTSWIGAQDPSENLEKGIRVVVRVRGCVNSTQASFNRTLATWRKTTWVRSRGGKGRKPGNWNLVEHMVPISEKMYLEDRFVHMVQFHYPDRAWASLENSKSGPERSHVGMVVTLKQDRTPPNPPKPKRVLGNFHGTTRDEKGFVHTKDEVVDTKHNVSSITSPKGHDASSLAKQEESSSPKGHDASSLTKQEESSIRDPDIMSDSSSGTISPCKLKEVAMDIEIWEQKGIKKEQVKEEEIPQSVCFVGILDSVKTSTMTKRQKKSSVSGLESLQHHDQVLNGCFGVANDGMPVSKNVLVVTSNPRIFDHPCIRVCDVGPEACHLEEEAQIGMNELCEGIDLAIVVVRYESPKSPSHLERLLSDLESHAITSGMKLMHVDTLEANRWNENRGRVSEMHLGAGLAFTTNDPEVGNEFNSWVEDRDVDSLLTWEFTEWLVECGCDLGIRNGMSVAFPAVVAEDEGSGKEQLDVLETPEDQAMGRKIEQEISEEQLLDEVDIPGLPASAAERRARWRKLPSRVRIGIRRLHRQFGRVPVSVMVNLLKAARIDPAFIEAAKLHRCPACEDTPEKKKTHKVSMPSEYRFNHTLGIDLLEIVDIKGQKYMVMNMVCVGTTFQLCHVVRVGHGQCSNSTALRALQTRWFSWAGHPEAVVCDRGLHNRGVMSQYMSEHNIQVYHTPLETPEGIARVERHGGIVKAMFRKVAYETQPSTQTEVQTCLDEVCRVKNGTARHGGFSPAQWVLGRSEKGPPSVVDESSWCDLGAIESRHDPTSIFAMHHMARIEAQKAFVHLDTSKRVARALLKNASPIDIKYEVGDVVVFRRDNNVGSGKTSWSPASRVIGFEGKKNVWVLTRGVPVLISAGNLRPARDAEALAAHVLTGKPILPGEIVSGQQSFVDERTEREKQEEREETETIEVPDEDHGGGSLLAPIPEGEVVNVEDEEDERDFLAEALDDIYTPSIGPGEELEGEPVESRARVREAPSAHETRNVRPRLDTVSEPEHERTSASSRAASEITSWPNIQDVRRNSLNDLPVQIARHFQRVREREEAEYEEEANFAVEGERKCRKRFVAFMASRVHPDGVTEEVSDDEMEGTTEKKVNKLLVYEHLDPETRKAVDEARQAEWSKFERFGAAVPVIGKEKDELVQAGHEVIPSKWVDVNKNDHLIGTSQYVPKFKSRMVSCGNFEHSDGLRSDSPTSELESHHVVAAWSASHATSLKSADITSAYFQAQPLDRVLLMRQPRGGLPGVDPTALLLIRVPIYGLCDSGRGFWMRLDGEAKAAGFTASRIYPSFYYCLNDHKKTVAVLTTHVDDLLFSSLPEGEHVVEKLLSRFEIGSAEKGDFRYCGKQFTQNEDGGISINVADNTRKIRKIKIKEDRKMTEPLKHDDLTQLRSVIGSLSWIARQGRPDVQYLVSRLQVSVKGATVEALKEANRVVTVAQASMNEVCLNFPARWVDWDHVGILTFTDASFCNEKGYKSQQGRIHFLADSREMKKGTSVYRVYPLTFNSTTIKRVCRATLQAETYSLQAGLEAGDRIRALICEMKGGITEANRWDEQSRTLIPHLCVSDCRSLVDYVNSSVPAKTQDKRLGIELASIRQSVWNDQNERTWNGQGGDKIEWTATATMPADCLTKSMKPTYLLKILKEAWIGLQQTK